jgi:hypothetical protein
VEPERSLSLEALVAETRADVRHLQADVQELRHDIRRLHDRIDRLDGRIDRLLLVQYATLAAALGSVVTALIA